MVAKLALARQLAMMVPVSWPSGGVTGIATVLTAVMRRMTVLTRSVVLTGVPLHT